MSIPGTIQFPALATTPSPPPTGSYVLYIKTDNTVNIEDSFGNVFTFGATNAITALTGDVSAVGPGSAVTTVNFVGGESAANVASATAAYFAATSANIPSTLVLRDGSGNFSAGTITANLTGTATNATTSVNFTGSLVGDVTGTQSATVVSFVGGSSAASVHSAELLANAATPSNTASTIVKRDASGNFSAGIVTANLSGNATTSTTSTNFTGSLSGDVTGTQSATVVSTVGGQSATAVATAAIAVAAATSSNTASTLVLRDGSGNFSAGTITANLTGTATNATNAITSVNFTGSLSGDVTGTQSATSISSATVTGKLLTGYTTGTNTPILSTDSILIAFEKLQAQVSGTTGSAITALTGDVSATGPGSATATVNSVGGQSASAIAATVVIVGNATSSNTASTLVLRNASGNFSAGTITANLTGTATNATTAVNFTGSLSGDVTGTQTATVVSTVGGVTASAVATSVAATQAATSSNTASTLVLRDASGNFSAGTITSNLTGTATNATTAVNFTGSLSGDVTGTQSATSISSTTVTGKLLTGYTTGTNTPILATNSILTAFENLQAQISATVGSAITALTGDGTATGPGSAIFTLATVNTNVGSFGGSTSIPSFTVNAKGLITAASGNAVVAPAGTLTGTTLASNVVNSSLTSVGTIVSGVWNGTALTAPYMLALPTNEIYVGNGSNQPAAVAMSGDVSIVSSGATSIASTTVTGKLLTGYTTGTNTPIIATNSILTAFENLQAQVSATVGSAITALTGDGTATGPGSVTFTLSTVNSNVGSFGSSTAIPSFTVNAKGLITAASTSVVVAPAGTLTGTTLNSTVVSSSLTSVGTITSGVWNGTPLTAPYMLALPTNDIYVGNGSNQPAAVTMSGDINIASSGATTIQANVVSNSKLAQAPADTLKGNNTGSTANVTDLTVSQVNTMLGTVTTIGAIDTNANSNGLFISGNTLSTQSASVSNPGMVNTATQSFAGNKTFTGTVNIIPASTSALVINSTSFVHDSVNNALGIGVQPATTVMIDGVNTSGASKLVQMTGYGTGSTTGYRGRFARGTLLSPTATQSGDTLSVISGRGYGTSQFAAASTGVMNIVAGENFTNTSNMTYLQFQATPTGSVTSAEHMRVAATGVTLGPQSASTDLHTVNGGWIRTTRTITGSLTVDTTTTDDIIFCNQSAGITITLPTPTNGRTLTIVDISGNAQTNNITIARHASELIEGLAASKVYQTNYGSLVLTADVSGNWWTIG